MMFERLRYSETGNDGFLRNYFNFTGVGVESLSYEEMINRIDKWLTDKNGRSHHIACINAYCIALSLSNRRLRTIYNTSDLAGPDGMPFVRWLRMTGKRICDRFCAPDIAEYLAEKSREKAYTFYLYGGAPEVLEKMREYLITKFPHIRILGSCSPPFRPLTEKEDAKICYEINSLKPDILLVGLGTPKQDYWIEDHIEKIRGTVMIASGATFDFFGGRIKMAPNWIRSSGFEWLFRLFSKDFKRLWKRYTFHNLVFIVNFLSQLTGLLSFQVDRRHRS
jgi:N-acetylglucosaminyldiphosphoundecaprenol N-acetyl-beta-D-mannosaminyltransferase